MPGGDASMHLCQWDSEQTFRLSDEISFMHQPLNLPSLLLPIILTEKEINSDTMMSYHTFVAIISLLNH